MGPCSISEKLVGIYLTYVQTWERLGLCILLGVVGVGWFIGYGGGGGDGGSVGGDGGLFGLIWNSFFDNVYLLVVFCLI